MFLKPSNIVLFVVVIFIVLTLVGVPGNSDKRPGAQITKIVYPAQPTARCGSGITACYSPITEPIPYPYPTQIQPYPVPVIPTLNPYPYPATPTSLPYPIPAIPTPTTLPYPRPVIPTPYP